MFEIRNQELVGNYYGEEKQGEFYELSEKLSNSIKISTDNSYISRLKNCLQASTDLKKWVYLEVGTSYSVILDRLYKDKTDPRKKGKKKAGFKLGEGSIYVLENIFYQQTLDEAVGDIPEASEITEGEDTGVEDR